MENEQIQEVCCKHCKAQKIHDAKKRNWDTLCAYAVLSAVLFSYLGHYFNQFFSFTYNSLVYMFFGLALGASIRLLEVRNKKNEADING